MKVALQQRTEVKWIPQLCLLPAKIGFPRTSRRSSRGAQFSPLLSSDLSSGRSYFNHQKRAVCKLVAQRQTSDDEGVEKMVKLDNEANRDRWHQSRRDHWIPSPGNRPCATDHASFSLGCILCTGGFLFWQFYPEKSRRGIPPTCCSYWDTEWDIDFATSAATPQNAESHTTHLAAQREPERGSSGLDRKRSNANSIDKPVDARNAKPQRRRRNVLLIRHGQYQNVGQSEDNIQGLTELGFKQAEATGQRLQQLLQGKRVNAIYHSTMKRSIETAKAVSAFFHDVDVTQDPDISEGVPVAPVPSSPTFKPTEKEISKDHPRIERAFRRHIHRPAEDDFEDTFDILVCHGNVIRYMFCRALQFRGEAWLRLATYNCGVTWLTIDEEGYVSCREFGNVGHLKAEDITYH